MGYLPYQLISRISEPSTVWEHPKEVKELEPQKTIYKWLFHVVSIG